MIETIYIEEAILQHPRVIEMLRVFRKPEKDYLWPVWWSFQSQSTKFSTAKTKTGLNPGGKIQTFCHGCPLRLWYWGKKKLLFFTHAQLFVRFAGTVFYKVCINQPIMCCLSIMKIFRMKSNNGVSKLRLKMFISSPAMIAIAWLWSRVTQFAEKFLPFFEKIPNAWLELRTRKHPG